MRRLDRYIIREILGPLTLGFLVYTFILLLNVLFKSAEMVVRRGLPFAEVGELLLLSLPNIVVLTIPMALLFGILLAVGRLAADSELVALRAAGISLLSLYRPILLLSGFLTLVAMALMIWVLPWGNTELQLKRLELVTRSVSTQVQPRVFHEEFPDQILYVFDIPEGENRWHGVFLSDAVPSFRNNLVTVAEWGRVRVGDDGEEIVLELENAVQHEMDVSQPDRYNITYHRRLEVLLEEQFTSTQRQKISASKTVRELGLGELREWIGDAERSAEDRRLARVEIHKKFALPFACLVFGLFGLPLGFNTRRGGKASGFAVSLLVILFYYVLLSSGEESARLGDMPPWLAMWLPNLLLAAAGLFLLARRNQDKSLLLSRIDRWIRHDLHHLVERGRRWLPGWTRSSDDDRADRAADDDGTGPDEATPASAGAEASGGPPEGRRPRSGRLVIRLPRFSLGFPNRMDRYVAGVFFRVFGLTALSALVLYIVGDLTEQADDLFQNDVAHGVVVGYYRLLSLQILYEISPIIVLITTLVTFSLLAHSNEVTAAKALGISLYRLAMPVLLAALGISAAVGFLGSEILPTVNQEAAILQDRIKGRETSRTYRRADRQWLFGQGRYIYNYLLYDEGTRTLQRLQVFDFDESFDLSRRLMARSATHLRSDEWTFEDGWVRRFDDARVAGYERFEGDLDGPFPEPPEYFTSEIRPPDQMTYRQLEVYIDDLRTSGQARTLPELEVALYTKIAYPVICLVMALVALPFAFRIGRQGALYGVGVSIVLGMAFFAVYAFFTTMGQAGILPPMVAVWSPGILFASLGLYLFLGVRT